MGEVIPKNILIGNVVAVSISSHSLHIIYVMTRPAADTGRDMYECGDGRTITMLLSYSYSSTKTLNLIKLERFMQIYGKMERS